jgi:hypothetical protein
MAVQPAMDLYVAEKVGRVVAFPRRKRRPDGARRDGPGLAGIEQGLLGIAFSPMTGSST